MKKYFFEIAIVFFIACGLVFTSCGNSNATEESTDENAAVTPVTITNAIQGPIEETVDLNAVSIFQMKISVKATVTGYLEQVNTALGENVGSTQILFSIKTKEANALQFAGDTLLSFSGIIKIKAQQSGIITTMTHHKGDYVQEGDELAVISDRSSLVFLLQVPFEMNRFVRVGKVCDVILPGDSLLKGVITGTLPQVDAVSQTQQYVLKINGTQSLPENLIAKVRIVKSIKTDALIIPKEALLSDETQVEFWVMKLINENTAVKIIVNKGIETEDHVEIISSEIKTTDKILLTGNYGLPDTAKVIIQIKE